MFHGTKDRTIHPKVSVVVYEALKKYHKEVQLYMLEGADHGGSEFFSDKVLDIMEAFLQRIVSASQFLGQKCTQNVSDKAYGFI